MTYSIIIREGARQFIGQQNDADILLLVPAVDSLALDPHRIMDHSHSRAEYKMYVGNFYILYDIYETDLTVDIIRICEMPLIAN